MTIRRGTALAALGLLLLLLGLLAGCGGDDDGDGDDEAEQKEAKLVDGTFVGKVRGTDAFVAVVTSPAAKGERRRDAVVFVCDAEKVCEWLQGTASGNSFKVASDDDDAEGKGSVAAKSARGSV